MGNVWMIVADDLSASSVAGVARASGREVDAFVFGPAARAEQVARYGVSSVTRFDAEAAPAEGFAKDFAHRALEERPAAVVLSDDATARVLAGFVAAELHAPVATSVVSIAFDGEKTTVEQMVAEDAGVQVLEATGPVVCVVADGCPDAEEAAPTAVQEGTLDSFASFGVVSNEAAGAGATGLATAERVVGVGLGIGAKENLAMVDELASALDAAVTCTLPLCDNYHWFEHSSVVGTSTQKISPRLYVACGVSGAPQHLAGVRGAKVIVAINNDPDAPIFRECAYGIVGDVTKVLPSLVEAIEHA